MSKKLLSMILVMSMLFTYIPGITVFAADEEVTANILIDEDFNDYIKGALPTGNFSVKRAGNGDMSVVNKPDDKNMSLYLSCKTGGEVYIAKSVSNPENAPLSLSFRFMLDNKGNFDFVKLTDLRGNDVNLFNVVNGKVVLGEAALKELETNRWYYGEMVFNVTAQTYSLAIDGDKIIKREKLSIADITSVRMQLSDCNQKLYIDDVLLKRADTIKTTSQFNENSTLVMSNVLQMEADDITNSGLLMYRNSTKAIYEGDIVYTNAAPVEIDTNIYLPVRFTAEKLGAEVVWNNEEKVTFLVFKDNTYKLTAGKDAVCADGSPLALTAPVIMHNGSLYMSAADITKLLERSLLVYNCFIMISGEEELFNTADERVKTEVMNNVKYERPTGEEVYNKILEKWPNNQHPRIHGSKADFDKVKALIDSGDEFATKLYYTLKGEADAYLSRPVPTHSPTMSREDEAFQNGTKLLAFMWNITGEEKYAKRCWEQLEAAISFPDWNHQVSFLTTGQIAEGIAVGYDWLYNYLTPDQRSQIESGMMKLFLTHALKSYRGEYNSSNAAGGTFNWVKDKYNFNPACNLGVLTMCFAMAEVFPQEAKEALGYAFRSYEIHLNEYEPDGAWTEGPDYGYVTLNMNAKLISAIETVLGDDYGFSTVPGLLEGCYYQQHILGPTGFFNYSDGNKQTNPEYAFSFFMASHLNDDALGYYRKQSIMQPSYKYSDNTHPEELFWYKPELVADSAEALDKDKTFRKAETALMRSAWDKDAVFAGLHAHDNHAPHGQLDIGTFVYDAFGVGWFRELGYDTFAYTAEGAEHRTYRSRAEGHNTIVIDDSKYSSFNTDENGMIEYKKYDFDDLNIGETPSLFRIWQNPSGTSEATIASDDGENKYLKFKLPVAENKTAMFWEIVEDAPYIKKGATFKIKMKFPDIKGINDNCGDWKFFEICDTNNSYTHMFYLTPHGFGTISGEGWQPLIQPAREDVWYDMEFSVNLDDDTYSISMTDGENTVSYKNLTLSKPMENIYYYKLHLGNAKSEVYMDDLTIKLDPANAELANLSARKYDQEYYGSATIDKFVTKPQGSYAVIDTTPGYRKWVESSTRGLAMLDQRRTVVVRDEIKLKSNADVYWFAHTDSANNITISDDGKSAILKSDGKRLWVGILSDIDAGFEVMKATPMEGSPNPTQQQGNTEFKKLAIKAENVDEFNVSVAMIPLMAGEDKPRNIPDETAIADWSIPDGELPKLDSITVDGKLIDRFSPERNLYDVLLSGDTASAPVVSATAQGANVTVTQATSAPGYALITVEKDGKVAEYMISFRVKEVLKSVIQGYVVTEYDVKANDQTTATAGPENVLDDNLDTRWVAEGTSEWIQIDFNQVATLNRLQIAWYFGEGRKYQFDIQMSDDATRWKTVYSGESSGESADLETYVFDTPSQGRYLRIMCKGFGTGTYNNISEIR